MMGNVSPRVWAGYGLILTQLREGYNETATQVHFGFFESMIYPTSIPKRKDRYHIYSARDIVSTKTKSGFNQFDLVMPYTMAVVDVCLGRNTVVQVKTGSVTVRLASAKELTVPGLPMRKYRIHDPWEWERRR
jgi:hypothetical protein